jgi:hypothetical protein
LGFTLFAPSPDIRKHRTGPVLNLRRTRLSVLWGHHWLLNARQPPSAETTPRPPNPDSSYMAPSLKSVPLGPQIRMPFERGWNRLQLPGGEFLPHPTGGMSAGARQSGLPLAASLRAFDHIPPRKQKELLRLVLHKAVLTEDTVKAALCGRPPEIGPIVKPAEAPCQMGEWLPEQMSGSVVLWDIARAITKRIATGHVTLSALQVRSGSTLFLQLLSYQ